LFSQRVVTLKFILIGYPLHHAKRKQGRPEKGGHRGPPYILVHFSDYMISEAQPDT